MRANVLISINLLNPTHVSTEPKTRQSNYEELNGCWGCYVQNSILGPKFF